MRMFEGLGLTTMLSWALQVFALYLVGSVFFDVVHWALHQAWESKRPWLKAIGGLHHTHHRFLDTRLEFNDALIAQNFWRHRTGEYANQMLGASLGYFVLHPVPVL